MAPLGRFPFLNGGLFERRYGEVSLDLPDEIFDLDEGMLGYLNHWTFTVAEETADEIEVAVDPEMLGRIFWTSAPGTLAPMLALRSSGCGRPSPESGQGSPSRSGSSHSPNRRRLSGRVSLA